jgi:hypothetical protein
VGSLWGGQLVRAGKSEWGDDGGSFKHCHGRERGGGWSGAGDRQPMPPLHRGPDVTATLLLEILRISALM